MKASLALVCILGISFALHPDARAGSVTCYVATSGTSTNSGLTPTLPKALPSQCLSTVLAYVPSSTSSGAGHNIFILTGTYDDHLATTSTRAVGMSIIGVTDLNNPATSPAGFAQVWLRNASYNVIDLQASNVTVKNLSLTGTNSTRDLLKVTGCDNFWGDHLYLYNSGRGLFLANPGATNVKLTNCLGKGAGTTDAALKFTLGTSGEIANSIFTNSDTKPLGTGSGSFALLSQSDGTITVKNSILIGSDNIAVSQSGTGSTTVNNSILSAGASRTGTVIGEQESGNLTFNHCVLIPSWRTDPVTYFSGTVGDIGNVKSGAWLPARRARSGFIVPCIDDSANVAYANDLATLLEQRGMQGTFFVDGYDLLNPVYTSQIQNLQARNVLEIGHHTWSHSDLTIADGAKVFDVTHGSDTITIDRTTGLLSTTVDGDTLSFKTVQLADIANWLRGKGFTVAPTTLYATGGPGAGQVANVALGEIIAAGSAVNAIKVLAVDETAGLYKSEIVDAKKMIENTLKVSITSLATPFGRTNKTAESSAHNAGLLMMRPFASSGANSAALSSFNMFRVPALPASYLIGANDDATKARVRSVLDWAAQAGGMVFFLGHNPNEISLAQWGMILDLIKAEYPEITVTNAGTAINTITSSGLWTDTSNSICTAVALPYPCCTGAGTGTCTAFNMARAVWTDASDFRLLNYASAAIGAGDNSIWSGISGATDFAGTQMTDDAGNVLTRTIHGATVTSVDSGPYQYVSDPRIYNLFIKKAGSGNGTVVISPPSIACDTDCTAQYNQVTSVTLRAIPSANAEFQGWSGSCGGTADCQMKTDADKTVTATFTQTTTITGDLDILGGALRIDSNSSAGPPSCVDDSQRGMVSFYHTLLGGDVMQVCGKDAGGNFSWKTLLQW